MQQIKSGTEHKQAHLSSSPLLLGETSAWGIWKHKRQSTSSWFTIILCLRETPRLTIRAAAKTPRASMTQLGRGQTLFSHMQDKSRYREQHSKELSFSLSGGKRTNIWQCTNKLPGHALSWKLCKARTQGKTQKGQTSSSNSVFPVKIWTSRWIETSARSSFWERLQSVLHKLNLGFLQLFAMF